MTSLVRYDAACRALAEAKAVDEVKDLMDKAEAMRVYAHQAKNKTLEVDAAEIRIRAERRLGEMLAQQKAEGGLSQGARLQGAGSGSNSGSSAVVTNDHRPKLADAGISKDLSSRAQKIAAVPEPEFEQQIGEWRDRVEAENARVTTNLVAAGERVINKKAAKPAANDSDLAAQLGAMTAERDELKVELADAIDRLGEMGNDLAAYMIAAEGQGSVATEVKALQREVETLKIQRDGQLEKNTIMARQIKSLQRKIEKYERPGKIAA